MKASTIKGALLEYVVRSLLKNCGFTASQPDNLFTFERGGLFFVNGRGSAHDADVIMNPPIQMPFLYPTQLLFECKAYGGVAGLPVVRNALGLRNDLNEFEIVTRDSLQERQNNRRASYAIDVRLRYLYQVGAAAINDFTKPAIEFATNNKIPIVSLSWFLDSSTIQDINDISDSMLSTFASSDIQELYQLFKARNLHDYDLTCRLPHGLRNTENIFTRIISATTAKIASSYVGLLETGDIIFLFSRTNLRNNILDNQYYPNFQVSLRAEIHWYVSQPNEWILTITDPFNQGIQSDFNFYLPTRLMNHWVSFSLNKQVALNIKEQFFSRIFIFNQVRNPQAPFSIVTIDRRWLDEVRQNEVIESI